MNFTPIALKKLDQLLARGFTIIGVVYDATVHETDGKFSTLVIKITKEDESETGTIDSYGRVIWQ